MTLRAEDAYVALVHHPVYDKHHRIVSTALTNLDLHDIARSVRTYNLGGYFVVHPVAAQRQLAERVLGHWRDEGAEMNDFRRQALERVRVVATLDDAVAQISRDRKPPHLVSTAARPSEQVTRCGDLALEGRLLLVFGTGHGLADEVMARCPTRLGPIQASSDYNHLSVRSAVAIMLDRLYGDRQNGAPFEGQ